MSFVFKIIGKMMGRPLEELSVSSSWWRWYFSAGRCDRGDLGVELDVSIGPWHAIYGAKE